MNRERFYLYIEDYNSCIKRLSQEQKGALLDEVFLYMRDGTIPKESDPLLDMAFSVVKNKLDKDTTRYNETCAIRRKVGALGGKAKAASKSAEATKEYGKKVVLPPMSNKPSDIRKMLASSPIKPREEAFKGEVAEFANKYDLGMLKEFCNYWLSKEDKTGLMRFEAARYKNDHGSFDVKRRLVTWKRKGEKFKLQAQESRLQVKKEEEAKITSFIKEDDKI